MLCIGWQLYNHYIKHFRSATRNTKGSQSAVVRQALTLTLGCRTSYYSVSSAGISNSEKSLPHGLLGSLLASYPHLSLHSSSFVLRGKRCPCS